MTGQAEFQLATGPVVYPPRLRSSQTTKSAMSSDGAGHRQISATDA